jgi:cytoskeletal protein RodZ
LRARSSNRNGLVLETQRHWRKLSGEIVEELTDHIGERLSKARERAGLTVDDIIFRTRIPRSVVEALEAGDFSIFSSPTYAKSFLSQYSAFLNVDAQLWLDALEPAAFVAGEFTGPLWKAANPSREEPAAARQASSGGFVSALTMLAATCGLIFMAMKGYEFFEARFGVELSPEKATDEAPAAPVPPTAVTRQEKIPEIQEKKEELPPPPPRAIIVR